MKQIQHLLLVASLASATLLTAQPAGPGEAGPHRRGPHGPGHLPAILVALDADRSGDISAAEIANAPAAIRTLDANGDGTVTRDELMPPRRGPAPGRPDAATGRPTRPEGTADRPGRPENAQRPHPVFPVMLALDADGDGTLSAAEIDRAATSLKALDANGDGQLTRDELQPLPPTQ